jgi:hypothetical protein
MRQSGQGFSQTATEEWQQRILKRSENDAVNRFCEALHIDWGRLDFLEWGELIFLEFNANGQWTFLDPLDKIGLVGEVTEYLLDRKSDSGMNYKKQT